MQRVSAALLALALSAGAALAADWTVVPLGTTADIRCIGGYVSQAWVVGAGGFVAESNPARTTFAPVDVGTTADLLSFLEVGTRYVVGAHGVVRVWTGTTWIGRDIPDPAEDFFVFSRQNGSATAVGTHGGIYRTDNYAGTWTAQASGTTAALHAGSDWEFAVGDQGTVLSTPDLGLHWSALATGTTANLYGFIGGNGAVAVAVGAGGTIIRTADGGAHWTPRATGTTNTLRAADWSREDGTHFVVVGDGGVILTSSDAGDTWCRLDAGTTANLHAVAALSNTEFFVGGEGGLLLHTTTGGGPCGTTDAGPLAQPEDLSMSLDAAGPNPVHGDRLSLAFSLPGAARATLEVLDANSRRVMRREVGALGAGRHSIVLKGDGPLAPGVYFVRLTQGARFATTRVTVLE